MKNGYIELMDLEFEYKLWKRRLDLFLQEIELLLNQNKILPENDKRKSLNSVEIIALEEHISEVNKLKSRIKVKEQELTFYNKDFPITEDHDFFKDHIELRLDNSRILQIHLDRVKDVIRIIGTS
ncbi:hypothetical protein [Labilibacter marinus]|uniref:hypothetical protein n=1 Tax=Labilibacter marinus TaxID=1477105 RepID=UPI00094F9FB5|nr:hypothetical protein [Labilibacter marinus]